MFWVYLAGGLIAVAALVTWHLYCVFMRVCDEACDYVREMFSA